MYKTRKEIEFLANAILRLQLILMTLHFEIMLTLVIGLYINLQKFIITNFISFLNTSFHLYRKTNIIDKWS